MTWDWQETHLQTYIHHFLHIILCDTKCLTYPSIFPPPNPQNIKKLNAAGRGHKGS